MWTIRPEGIVTSASTVAGSAGATCPASVSVSPTVKICPGWKPVRTKNISTGRPSMVSSGPPFGPPASPKNGGNTRPPTGSLAGTVMASAP